MRTEFLKFLDTFLFFCGAGAASCDEMEWNVQRIIDSIREWSAVGVGVGVRPGLYIVICFASSI